jgi:predicted  nucleic acid-binding Zn-ribbon protein
LQDEIDGELHLLGASNTPSAHNTVSTNTLVYQGAPENEREELVFGTANLFTEPGTFARDFLPVLAGRPHHDEDDSVLVVCRTNISFENSADALQDIFRCRWNHNDTCSWPSTETEQLSTPIRTEHVETESSQRDGIDQAFIDNTLQNISAARASMTVDAPRPSSEGTSGIQDDAHTALIVPAHSVQLSADFANDRFFLNLQGNQLKELGLSSLFNEPEWPETVKEDSSSSESNGASFEASSLFADDDGIYLAQPMAVIENSRRDRMQFAKRLESALTEQEAVLKAGFEKQLAKQQEALEVRFEESYASTAQLHEIEMLNLQDDHEAKVNELRQTLSEVRARLQERSTCLRRSRRDIQSLREEYNTIEEQLQERSGQCDQLLQAVQDRETVLQRQNEEVLSLRQELDRARQAQPLSVRASLAEAAALQRSHTQLTDRYNGLMTAFYQLKSERNRLEAQLEASQNRVRSVQAAIQHVQRQHDRMRARYDHAVCEAAKDVNWHVAWKTDPLAMKPMHTEDEIRGATVQLRQMLEAEIQSSADLRREFEATQLAKKNKVKKLKRVVGVQNQEKKILEMALTMAQDQRDHWAEEYREIAEAVTSRLHFSSFARGIAERHLHLQETRRTLEADLIEAKIRGDRAILECAIRKCHEAIKLEKRDAEIASWKQKHKVMKGQFDHKQSLAREYKRVIDKDMPDLRQRNSEVENLLADQIARNVHADHKAVFDDLHSRIRRLKVSKEYWEHEFDKQRLEHNTLQMEWNFFEVSTFNDLTNARGLRDARDKLEVENATLKERFADELLLEPLAIPDHRKTSKQIEDDFKLESIDNLLLKQWEFTFHSVPRAILEMRDVPPWEHVRVRISEDIEAQKARWIERRDRLVASFRDGEEPDVFVEHELTDDEEEEEDGEIKPQPVVGTGKAKATGPRRGNDGQFTMYRGLTCREV